MITAQGARRAITGTVLAGAVRSSTLVRPSSRPTPHPRTPVDHGAVAGDTRRHAVRTRGNPMITAEEARPEQRAAAAEPRPQRGTASTDLRRGRRAGHEAPT